MAKSPTTTKMITEEKLKMIKNCMLATNTTIDDKDWDEMVLTDGFSGFLDGTCLAMDNYFYKHGIGLLKFKEKHPEIKEEAELLLGYELSKNIKRTLKKIDYKNGKHK